jgi:hypothetical protein
MYDNTMPLPSGFTPTAALSDPTMSPSIDSRPVPKKTIQLGKLQWFCPYDRRCKPMKSKSGTEQHIQQIHLGVKKARAKKRKTNVRLHQGSDVVLDDMGMAAAGL